MLTIHELGWVRVDQTSNKIMKIYNKNYHFIVDFNIADSDCDCLIKLITDFSKHLTNCSRYDASVSKISTTSSHSEGLASSSLSIAQNSSIISLYN